MTGIDRDTLERLLAPLFECPDCHGRGKREHAIWPEIKVVVSDTPEIVNEASADYVAPRKEFKTCETCHGTGRH